MSSLDLPSLMLCAAGLLAGCAQDASAGPESAGAPASSEAADAERPGFFCATPMHDFGDVWEGEVLSHEFVFEARGDAPVVVEAVKADCGCTVVELGIEREGAAREVYTHGSPIERGARLFVDLEYDTHGKRGRAPRTITLYTDHGRETVTIGANVRPWLVIEPEQIQLPLLGETDTTEASFRVSSASGERFLLTHTGAAIPPQVVVTPKPVGPDEPGENGRAATWNVAITLGPDMPLGSHVYPIYLETDVEVRTRTADDDPALEIPRVRASPWLTVRVVGEVSADPGTLVFGLVGRDEIVARTVRVQSHDPGFELPEPKLTLEPVRRAEGEPGGDEPFLLGATADLTARRAPSPNGEDAWDVQVLFSGLDDSVQGTFLGRLVIETGHPGEPLLEVTVSGVCLEPPRDAE